MLPLPTPRCCGIEHSNSDHIHPRILAQKCAIFILSPLFKLCKINKLEHDLGFLLNGSPKTSKRPFTSSQTIPGTKSASVSNRKCARKGIYQRSDSAVANNNPPAHWTSSSIQALEASSSFRRLDAEEKAQQPRICGAQRHARKEGDKLGAAQSAQKPRGETGAAAKAAN